MIFLLGTKNSIINMKLIFNITPYQLYTKTIQGQLLVDKLNLNL